MKLIRWILSNIILIAFVLALTYAYVYWDNLTGEDTPAGKAIAYLADEFDEVREFLDEYNIAARSDGDEGATKAPPVKASEETVAILQAPEPQPTAPQPQPRVQPEPAHVIQPPARTMPAPPVRPQPEPQAMPMQAMPPVPPPVSQAAPQSAPIPPAEPSPAAAGPETSPRELWMDARREFHRGNLEVSIRNYKEVIARTKNNFDAYGELGNVYFSSGNEKEAAAAYYEAAAIMVKLGQRARAASLLKLLGRLDSQKAQDLQDLLSPPSNV